jgi:hypothetical protein
MYLLPCILSQWAIVKSYVSREPVIWVEISGSYDWQEGERDSSSSGESRGVSCDQQSRDWWCSCVTAGWKETWWSNFRVTVLSDVIVYRIEIRIASYDYDWGNGGVSLLLPEQWSLFIGRVFVFESLELLMIIPNNLSSDSVIGSWSLGNHDIVQIWSCAIIESLVLAEKVHDLLVLKH